MSMIFKIIYIIAGLVVIGIIAWFLWWDYQGDKYADLLRYGKSQKQNKKVYCGQCRFKGLDLGIGINIRCEHPKNLIPTRYTSDWNYPSTECKVTADIKNADNNCQDFKKRSILYLWLKNHYLLGEQ